MTEAPMGRISLAVGDLSVWCFDLVYTERLAGRGSTADERGGVMQFRALKRGTKRLKPTHRLARVDLAIDSLDLHRFGEAGGSSLVRPGGH
jgi:hypothetical protein